jgi:Zn-dependent protease with chaperone function
MSKITLISRAFTRFGRQAILVLGTMGLLFYGLLQFADRGTTHIPFAWEKFLFDQMIKITPLPIAIGEDEVSKAWAQDLQTLIDKLAKVMDMPKDIIIKVDYTPDQRVNAVAIMGGQVIVFDGLINLAESENALSFVLAHELAHLKNRDGIRSMSRQSLITSAIVILFGTSGDVSKVANLSAALSSMKYSREVETAADEEAVKALARYYGHVNGMSQIFQDAMKMQSSSKLPPEILSTHPDFSGRLAHMEEIARQNGWNLTGNLTPMAFTMTIPDDEICTKSATLCRIENSVDRIRSGQTSLIEDVPTLAE